MKKEIEEKKEQLLYTVKLPPEVWQMVLQAIDTAPLSRQVGNNLYNTLIEQVKPQEEVAHAEYQAEQAKLKGKKEDAVLSKIKAKIANKNKNRK